MKPVDRRKSLQNTIYFIVRKKKKGGGGDRGWKYISKPRSHEEVIRVGLLSNGN